MYVNDNISALNAWRNLTLTSNRMNGVLEHLSSGLRINKAADDAAGLAISQKMLAQINGLDQATRNAQDGISLVQTAEGALGQIQDILQRMRQLAAQSSSDTETSSDRDKLQAEFDQLIQQIDDIAQDTEFNTMKLLDGSHDATNGPLTILVGPNSGQDLTIAIDAADSTTLGVNGLKINQDQATSEAALDAISTAIDNVSEQRAQLGAIQNRLQYIINNLQITSQNLSDAKSRITDTDMAREMAEFTKYQILQQAGVAMLAQANAMPQAVLKLLG
ncbi:MAG: flagellin FliC [Clostridia bacterium]|nr:flagellin FliC [Clostridia bacterium]